MEIRSLFTTARTLFAFTVTPRLLPRLAVNKRSARRVAFLSLLFVCTTASAHLGQPNDIWHGFFSSGNPSIPGTYVEEYVDGTLGTLQAAATRHWHRVLEYTRDYSGAPLGYPIPCPGWQIVDYGQCVPLIYPTVHSFDCTGKLTSTYCNAAGNSSFQEYPDHNGWGIDHLRPALDPGPGCNTVGNPCDVSTGNKFEVIEDYASNATGLRFTRNYNSYLGTYAAPGTNHWRNNFDRSIRVFDNGTPTYLPDDFVAVTREDGAVDYFWSAGVGAWTPSKPNSTTTLTQASTGWHYTKGDGSYEDYDASGQLILIVDPIGRRTTIAHTTNGTVVTGPYGHTLTIRPDVLIDPAGNQTFYSYDTNGNMTAVAYPDGTQRLYHYEDSRFLNNLTGVSIVAANGTVTRYSTFAYDASGRAISTAHAQTDNGAPQEKFTLSYDNDWQTTVADAVNTKEVFGFTATEANVKLLASHQYPDGRVVYKGYDALGNLTSESNGVSNTTTYTYNATKQRVTKTEASGTAQARTTNYQYLSPDLDLPTVIDTPSVYPGARKRTEIAYDANRNPTAITQRGYNSAGGAISRTVTLGYNTNGQVTSIDGPRTDVADITTLSYNNCTTGGACGQLASITNALGQVTTLDSYDANGRLLAFTNPNGVTTALTYDTRGRVTLSTETSPATAQRSTQYTFDAFGNIAQVIQPDGKTLNYGYDASQKLRTVTDNLGNTIKYAYDVKGNRTVENTVDATGSLVKAINYTYNQRNFVTAVNRGGSLTQYILNNLGDVASENDPNNHQDGPGYAYDALARITNIGKASSSTGFTYNVNDQVTQVDAPNWSRTNYAYNDLGDLEKEISPDRGTLTYAYNNAGLVISQTDARNVTVTYQYDALNRLTQIGYPTSTATVYTYDQYADGTPCVNGKGRVCQVTDSSSVVTNAYDDFGRLIQQNRIVNSISYVTSYQYDNQDRLIGMIYPNGRVVNYTRNAIGNVTDIQTTLGPDTRPIATNLQYRADGLLTGLTYGNGLTETRIYDLAQRLTDQVVGAISIHNIYDANGNLLNTADSAASFHYGFDSLDRLINDNGTGIGYDYNGNRANRGSYNIWYLSNTNKIDRLNGTIPVVYDPTGNITNDGTENYTYNDKGQLIAVRDSSNSPIAQYTYNADNLRITKQTATQGTVYHYDLSGSLLSETDTAGNLNVLYVYHPDTHAPILQLRKGTNGQDQWTYLTTDSTNTPRIGSDDLQHIVWRYRGEAFGNSLPNEDVVGTGVKTTVNLRFAGQYYDAESGLFYNWNRYYDPKIGRYITSDPIGLAGGLNTYGYVGNNPLRYVDPYGLWSTDAHNYLLDQFLAQQYPNATAAFIEAVKRGSAEADSMLLGYQGANYSYMHAMTSEAIPDAKTACTMMNRFIDQYMGSFKFYKAAVDQGQHAYDALAGFALGMALHPVMDSTSPAHANFQYWHPGDMWHHGIWPTSIETKRVLESDPQLVAETLQLMNSVMHGGQAANCSCSR